ncbi:RNA polymerase sigma-54 factor [Candidatus Poribacteria bacterium]|nr:MAG: RNA polymerase sigma-54 factor [Candidatus Poribacteria bacterium]
MYKAQLTQTPQLTQKTSITPRLQQALKVLNMPLQELTHFIRQELEQNPFLELEDDADELGPTLEELDPALEWNEPEGNLDQEDTAVDIDWDMAFEDRVSLSDRMSTKHADPDEPPPDVIYECSLHDHLVEQLDLAFADIISTETERAIAEYILGNLNDDGKLELKLFQMPCECLTALNLGEISAELHTIIQKGLQAAIGNSNVKFSKNATISRKKTTHTPAENEGAPINCTWQVNDPDNNRTYTIIYERTLGNRKPALNFYQLTLEDIAETVGCETTLVETVLREIQDNFEPIGIAHRDTREALLIQIRNQKPEEIQVVAESLNGEPWQCEGFGNKKTPVQSFAQEIIENYYDAFLNQQWHCIAEALKVDILVIDTVVKWIRRLSPYPGRYFTDPMTRSLKKNSHVDTVTPDVEIQYLNGKYQAISVDSYIPRLQMNPYYLNLMRNRQDTLDTEAKEWIEKRYRDASNLLSSLAQRGSTIARVTEAIFEVQTEFLTEGTKSIKPLTLRTIAERIGVHESTVSRVTSNKYVQTPHGMYPLRFFFSNELATTQGEAISAKQVKNLIQEMVDAETPKKPLSDQAISNALKTKGILLARRTVQKYRDELGIPTSRERSAVHAGNRAG